MTRSYQRHGLSRLMRRGYAQGLGGIDGRKAPFKAAARWAGALEEQLGADMTPAKATLLVTGMMVYARLECAYRWLGPQMIERGGSALVNTKRRAAYPVVDQIGRWAEHLNRIVLQLGLERRGDAGETESAIVALVKADLRKKRRRADAANRRTVQVQAEPE
jgi:hypothetical protein